MISSLGPRSKGGGSQPKFLHQLQYNEYKDIEDLLNINKAWETLAGRILCLKVTEIETFRRHNQRPDSSAASALLSSLSNRNTTIEQMFYYFHKIKLFHGMEILKDFVPERLHSMIHYGGDFGEIHTYKEYSQPLSVSSKMKSHDFDVDNATISQNVSTRHPGNKPTFQGNPTNKERQSGQIRPPGGQRSPCGPDSFTRYQGDKSPGPERGYTGENNYGGYPYPSLERGLYPQENRAPYPIYEKHPSIKSEQYLSLPPEPSYGRYHSNVPMYQHDYPSYPYPQYGPSLSPSEFMQSPRIRNPSEPSSEVSTASSSGGVPTVSDKELAEACDNWNINTRIGKGGYGEVYRGVWKYQDVAVKRIRKMESRTPQDEEHFQHSIKQCWKEINYLNRLRSEYIVPILAHSVSGEPCIVYQFMPNGSLHDRLKKSGGTPALSWQQRYNIAKGTSCGLQFLHRQDPVVIHGDIKSANILLDKAFEPKIGDFGLTREIIGDPKNTHMKLSQIHGTQFYLPDDFIRSKQLSTKVDTYSFGVVLFDLVTGKSPSHKDPVTKSYLLDILKGEESLPGGLVDTSWPEHTQDFQLCALLFKFGKLCSKERKKERPEMKEVFEGLQRESERIRIRKESAPEHKSLTPIELQQKYDSMERQNSNDGLNGKVGGGLEGVESIVKDAPNGLDAVNITDENVQEGKDRQFVTDLITFASPCSNTEATGFPKVSTDSYGTSPRGCLPLLECTSFYNNICVVKESSEKSPNLMDKIPEIIIESSNIPNFSILSETNSCDIPDFSNLVGQESETVPNVSGLIHPNHQDKTTHSSTGAKIDFMSDVEVSQRRISNPHMLFQIPCIPEKSSSGANIDDLSDVGVSQSGLIHSFNSYQIPDISGLAIADCSNALPDFSGLVGGDDHEDLPDFSGLVISSVLPDFSQLRA